MATDEQLSAIRAKIDALDTQLLELISERARCAQEVASVKLEASRGDSEEPPCFIDPRERRRYSGRFRSVIPVPCLPSTWREFSVRSCRVALLSSSL